MMKNSHRELLRSSGIVLARIALGALFFLSGLQILLGGTAGIGATTDMITSVGFPLAAVATYIVIAIKLLAGGALMVGYRVGLAAGALLIFTAAANVFFHLSPSEMGIFGMDMDLFKNLAIMGGLLYAMAYGPGDGWKLKM